MSNKCTNGLGKPNWKSKSFIGKKKPYSKLESKIVAISLSPCPQQTQQNSIPWDTKKCSATTKLIPNKKNLTLFYQTDLEP